jgi:hypothetical protein
MERRNPSKVGSSYAWFHEINETTGALVAATVKKFPIIKESTFGFAPGSEETTSDENGTSYTLSSGSGAVTFKGVGFRPRTSELLDFFVKNRTKKYLVIKVDNEKVINGKTGVYVYPNVSLAESFELKNNGSEFNFSFSANPYVGAANLVVNIDTTNTPGNPLLTLPAADRPASVTVAPGDLYAFAEN